MHEQLAKLIEWYSTSLQSGGYPLVALLMAIESSVVPVPSELVIPPAAHLAYTQGRMSIAGIVVAGTIGSWIGATAMYLVSRAAGRPLVLKYGKFVLIPTAKVHQAERWAGRFGNFGIFASRLLPVVRHLIGIPAGIVRMSYVSFSIYTLAGSAVWCTVLAWVGVKAGQDEALMNGELNRIAIWLAGALVLLGAVYYTFVHRHIKER